MSAAASNGAVASTTPHRLHLTGIISQHPSDTDFFGTSRQYLPVSGASYQHKIEHDISVQCQRLTPVKIQSQKV